MYRVWLATKATQGAHTAGAVRGPGQGRRLGRSFSGSGSRVAVRAHVGYCVNNEAGTPSLWPPRIEPAPDPPNHRPQCSTCVKEERGMKGSPCHVPPVRSQTCRVAAAGHRREFAHATEPRQPRRCSRRPRRLKPHICASAEAPRRGRPARGPSDRAVPAQNEQTPTRRLQNFRTSMPCFCKA